MHLYFFSVEHKLAMRMRLLKEMQSRKNAEREN